MVGDAREANTSDGDVAAASWDAAVGSWSDPWSNSSHISLVSVSVVVLFDGECGRSDTDGEDIQVADERIVRVVGNFGADSVGQGNLGQ